MKQTNFYTQGQQRAARILFTVWFLASCSPNVTLAAPGGEKAIVPATTTSPSDLALASAPPTPPPGGILQLPPDSPGSFCENLSFQARGGEKVRFQHELGQWRAEVLSRIGVFSRQAVLPVVCSQGEAIASRLEVLSRYPSWHSQRQIHVLGRNTCITLGEVVYVGELGLKGGGGGQEASIPDPAVNVGDAVEDAVGGDEQSRSGAQEESSSLLPRQNSLDWLRDQIAAGKAPKEVYPLIAERLADPTKTFSRSDQISLLTACVRYGQVNAEAIAGKDAVIVLGNTGAGKSTFINYLAGCELELKRISGHGRVLVVKNKALGGECDEVMRIGHGAPTTFMPQIAEVEWETYCDCPGFSDNRGPEINIANAVNIKQALSRAASIRMVVMVNYYSLKADHGNGFRDLLRTLTDLLGSEEAIAQHQESIRLGISQCPYPDLTCKDLWEDYIAQYVPERLWFLEDCLFIFNPLYPVPGWERDDCLRALRRLDRISSPASILSVPLNDSDLYTLYDLANGLEEEISESLSQGDFGTASAHFRHLGRLSVLDHESMTSCCLGHGHVFRAGSRSISRSFVVTTPCMTFQRQRGCYQLWEKWRVCLACHLCLSHR